MPRLQPASPDQIDRIYDESFPLWGAGLTAAQYRGLWLELVATRWARSRVAFLVWVEGTEVLSSLKLYQPGLRLDDTRGPASVIGAVFTPRSHRGRGHASRAVAAAIEIARQRGDLAVLLFSDIGTSFYRDLGFRALPALEYHGRLNRIDGAAVDELQLQPALAGDRSAIQAAHETSSRRRRIAVVRDDDHWEFVERRSRSYFRRLGDESIRARTLVVRREGRFEGYLSTVEARGELSVREVGAVDGRPETMARIVEAGVWLARREGLGRVHGWLPPDAASALRAWVPRTAARCRALPMLLRFDRADALQLSPAEAFIPFHDQF